MLVITVQPTLMLTKQIQMAMCMETYAMHIQIHQHLWLVLEIMILYVVLMEITTPMHVSHSYTMFKLITTVNVVIVFQIAQVVNAAMMAVAVVVELVQMEKHVTQINFV